MAAKLSIQKPKCYLGVGGRFISDDGVEFVVLAPDLESLKAIVAKEFKNPIDVAPGMCGRATLIDAGGVTT